MARRANYILFYGKMNEFFIMENSTPEEVKKECLKFDTYGNYGREGVTAYPLTEPIFKLDADGEVLINSIS